MTKNCCLFTVVTPRFLPGALVMLASFLRLHPTFDGDVVVVHWRLPRRLRDLLGKVAGRAIRFETPSAELRHRIAAIAPVRSPSRLPAACFYFVEAFRLREYEHMLYCDSDLLFRGAIDELLGAEDVLLAAPDRPALAGMCRDAATFARARCQPGGERLDAKAPRLLANTFNCGLLALNLKRAGANCYEELLALLTPEHYRGVRSADGFLLNTYFAGQQRLVSSACNFLVGEAAAIRAREGLRLEDAKVLHFNDRAKPWLTHEMIDWTSPDDRRAKPRPKAFKLWYETYVDVLANARVSDVAHRLERQRAG